MLLEILCLDGYTSLWDKYHDPDRELLADVRHFVLDNWNHYYEQANDSTRAALDVALYDYNWQEAKEIMLDLEAEMLESEFDETYEVLDNDRFEVVYNKKTGHYKVDGRLFKTRSLALQYVERVKLLENCI